MVAHAQPPSAGDGGEGPKNPPPKATATLVKVKRVGRPRQEFDLDHVKTLGSYAASFQEVASAFHTTKETIQNRMDERGDFYAAYQEGLSQTKLKLRHRQLQLAMDGDCKMLTWLGMQLLQQRNKTDEKHTVADKGRVVVFTIQQNPDAEDDAITDEEQVLEESTKPGVATPIEVATDERN